MGTNHPQCRNSKLHTFGLTGFSKQRYANITRSTRHISSKQQCCSSAVFPYSIPIWFAPLRHAGSPSMVEGAAVQQQKAPGFNHTCPGEVLSTLTSPSRMQKQFSMFVKFVTEWGVSSIVCTYAGVEEVGKIRGEGGQGGGYRIVSGYELRIACNIATVRCQSRLYQSRGSTRRRNGPTSDTCR